MKRQIALVGILAASALLTACGDDSSSSPSGKAAEYASLEEAGACAPSRYGETVLVTRTGEFYFSGGKRWSLVDDGEDGTSSAKGSSTSGDNRSSDWSWDVPKEARLNLNIPYGTMTDGRDGQTYKTVVIGWQTWMAENLNFDYKVAGASYGNWCYGDSARYCSVTGRLYTWAAAMDTASTGCGLGVECAVSAGRVRGVCPNGWHLPDQMEWETLFTAVGESTAGRALRATSGWYNNGNGTDAFGFSALPSGSRDGGGNFGDAGYKANFWSSSTEGFWSSSQDYTDRAPSMLLYYSNAYANQPYDYKNFGFAVRCLMD